MAKKKANQWELTIKQKVPSTVSSSIFDEKVKFRSDSLMALTSLLDTLACFEPVNETAYEISESEVEKDPDDGEGEDNV